ncbi:MAG: 1-acyl-sn-glycerol-3-phosphate acyltransferase [Candidatus Moranbacteria bacterium]|nr:1-acyl-sn-glycerol-3-phosphate acyltransferase [Candidatus Moranbacteria bacterium]
MGKIVAKTTQLIFSFLTYTTLKIFFDFEVRGKEKLKKFKNKPVIFAGNHNSRKFDGFITGTAIALPSEDFYFGELSPVRYLVFKSYFKWFRFETPLPFPVSIFSAIWLRFNNCIPIKSRRREEYKNLRLKNLLQSAVEALENGEKLFVFPEGKTGGDNKLRKGKRGVACLHRETGVPIVPVGISGSYKLFTLKNFLKSRNEKKVVVTFGEPIYDLWEEGDSKKSLKEGVDKVISEISKLI